MNITLVVNNVSASAILLNVCTSTHCNADLYTSTSTVAHLSCCTLTTSSVCVLRPVRAAVVSWSHQTRAEADAALLNPAVGPSYLSLKKIPRYSLGIQGIPANVSGPHSGSVHEGLAPSETDTLLMSPVMYNRHETVRMIHCSSPHLNVSHRKFVPA